MGGGRSHPSYDTDNVLAALTLAMSEQKRALAGLSAAVDRNTAALRELIRLLTTDDAGADEGEPGL